MECFISVLILVLRYVSLDAQNPCPERCSCDTNSIDCSNRSLVEIPSFPKISNRWLQVDLSNNNITHVKSRAFENVTIEMLQISHNQIVSFAADALVGSEDFLRFLFIQYNNLTSLPPALGTMRNVSSLSIHHNPVTSFSDDIFRNISQCLTFLAFGSPEMSSWPVSLKHLKNLNMMDVYALSFDELSDDVFDGLENSLNLVDFDSTSLRGIPRSINRLKNLQVLGLDNNQHLLLSGIPDDVFKDMDSVDMLSISNATFNTLPNMTQLINLRQILLSNTPIEFWSATTLPDQPIIQQIQLSGTALTKIPEALSAIKSLKHLELSSSKITNITSSDFRGLQKLETLNLWNSPIQNISDHAFSDNYSLTMLSLDNTNLTAIPKAVVNLPNIRSVSLDGNNITCTCEAMGWLKKWFKIRRFDVDGQCDNIRMLVGDYLYSELPKCPGSL